MPIGATCPKCRQRIDRCICSATLDDDKKGGNR